MTSSRLQLDLGIFAIKRPNFNYFGHSHNYDATILVILTTMMQLLEISSYGLDRFYIYFHPLIG